MQFSLTSKPPASVPAPPASATKTLPLVRRVVKDLLKLHEQVQRQREQLRGVESLSQTSDHSEYKEELADIRSSLKNDENRFQSCVDELRAIGVVTHNPFDGTIDFPALVHRRAIRLCWRPEEESVQYWHELDESSEKRKKISVSMFPSLAG